MSAALTTAATRPVDRRRLVFGLDAAVTGVNAVAYLAFADLLVDHLGASTGAYRAVGLGLLLFATAVAACATRFDGERSVPSAAWGVVAVNGGWVIASATVAIIGLGDLTSLGRGWVAAQATVVAGLAALQAAALRR